MESRRRFSSLTTWPKVPGRRLWPPRADASLLEALQLSVSCLAEMRTCEHFVTRLPDSPEIGKDRFPRCSFLLFKEASACVGFSPIPLL